MNVIKNFDDLKSERIFKNLLCFFLIIINTKVIDMIIIVNITKVVFCGEMLVIINDLLSLLNLI